VQTVEVLRLAYCGLTSAAGPAIGAGIVRGSRVKASISSFENMIILSFLQSKIASCRNITLKRSSRFWTCTVTNWVVLSPGMVSKSADSASCTFFRYVLASAAYFSSVYVYSDHARQAMMNIRLFQSPTKKDLNETASSEGNSGVTEVEKKDQVLTEGQPSAVDPPAEAEIVDADASAQGTGDTLGGTNKVSVVEAVKDGNEAVVESASVQQLLEK